MKILYIHQYFKTPSEPGSTRSYWIAKELIKHGHQVTMLTATDGIRTRVQKVKVDGIDVIYLRVHYDQRMSIGKRLISFFNFMLGSTFQAIRIKNVDLVIATSTPLTVGFPAIILKYLKKIPYIFEVRDLWPEVPIQMEGLRNPILKKMSFLFALLIYKNANHIVALSPGMVDGIEKRGISNEKISLIPNMAKIDAFCPRVRNYELMERLGLKKNSLKVIHFGSLGIANGAFTIIESAALLKGNDQIEFVFIGGGATEQDLVKSCVELDLENVHFLGKFPMDMTSQIVNLCDVSIVSFKDLPILYTNSPNKLFDSLSAGKAILVNSAGWTKELVERNACGAYVNPNRPEELAQKLLYWLHQPAEMELMGANSRKLAETKYDKTILCALFVKLVQNEERLIRFK